MRTCRGCASDLADASTPCPACGLRPSFSFSWVPSAVKLTAGFVLVALIIAIAVPGLLISSRASNEGNASSTLKTLGIAEMDFRANDRDLNDIQDFWTGDVAGLYCIGRDRSQSIKLIELSAAGADSAPLTGAYPVPIDAFIPSGPKAGYWYWAMRLDASPQPTHHLSRFAFLSYPDSRASGRTAFILNEEMTLYRRNVDELVRRTDRVSPGPVTHPGFVAWPARAVLKREWSPLD